MVKYRYEKAQDTLDAAKALFTENRFNHAVNRYYYAAFYAIQSLLATLELESRKHSGSISLFNKHFVKSGIFDKKYARISMNLFDERNDADYQDFKVFSKQEVDNLRSGVNDFLQAVGNYLSEKEWLA
ncbi:MAG: HEPN domain-containing protein [bacterium]